MKAFKGGFGSGTLATMNSARRGSRQPGEPRAVDDPYALSPDRVAEPQMSEESDLMWIRHDGDLNSWIGPFVMAGVNTRVVRRSNALQGLGLRAPLPDTERSPISVQAPPPLSRPPRPASAC